MQLAAVMFSQSCPTLQPVNLEELVFVDEEFLYKRITNKDVYVNNCAIADIPTDSVEQYGDSTTLKQVTEVLKTNYYPSYVSRQASCDQDISFSP